MGRELRVEYKGAIYHVIHRGNNKEFVFDKDIDKIYLINYVQYEETDDYDNIKSVGDEAYVILHGVRAKLDERKRLDEVLIDTGLSFEDFELVKKGSRERHLTQYKLAYINQALKLKYTMQEVGQNINMSCSAVLNLLNRHK